MQHADLRGATGLLGNEFAQADVTGTKLPDDIKDFKALEIVKEISQNARKIFFAMLLGCVYSWLTIASTTDVKLLTNTASSPLPIIQTEIPIAGFYWMAPFVLMCVYIYFHFYLLKLWKALASLPAILPDGILINTQLKGSFLKKVNLKKAILEYANLRNGFLSDSNLEGSSVRDAYLQEAHLLRANLTQADLMYANFTKAYIFGTNLQEAILQYADFQNAKVHETNLHKADFQDANLAKADFRFSNLIGAKNITIDQLSKVKTLYKAKLDPELLEQVKKCCPHLLEEPKEEKDQKEGTE